jgi:peptide/nickel transport system ATP-binding protein
MSDKELNVRDNEALTEDQAGLHVENLTITYGTESGPLDTVRNASISIKPGEIYGLVGESGSGKTTFARAVVRYLPGNGWIKEGSIHLDGIDLRKLTVEQVRKIWGCQVTMVHQSPHTSVNPSMRVGDQIAEMGRVHLGMDKKQAAENALDMLKQVRMTDPERIARRYPHQLSGGQLQRVLIAIALSTSPKLLIMDEPTTALDVTTEAVILDMVRELLPQFNTAVLYITHNLGVVARLCHRVGVIYAGELMEVGPLRRVFKNMLHPYTLGLLGSVPRVDSGKHDILLNTIPGYIPRPDNLPKGCIFAPRCIGAKDACWEKRPTLMSTNGDSIHRTACIRWKDMAEDKTEFTNQPGKREFEKREGAADETVLDVQHMKKFFPLGGVSIKNLLTGNKPVIHAVDDISVRVSKSHTMGIVGESGCGKTTLARCVAGLETSTDGKIILEGKSLPYAVAKRPRALLKRIQMVFQNPDASLNPQHTAGDSVRRPLSLLGNMSRQEQKKRVRELFEEVNLPADYMDRLPHELSGGEKQRVAIARAFATNPTLLICDEPITSLDVSVQASLLNLLAKLQDSEGTAYLFISHDLSAVRHLSDWIAVIYLGRLWEFGSASDVFNPPQHPYTEALFSALPIPDPEVEQKRVRLRGTVPSSVDIPPGCRFHTRCPRMTEGLCDKEEPPWQELGNYHRICCHIPIEELYKLQTGKEYQKGGAK